MLDLTLAACLLWLCFLFAPICKYIYLNYIKNSLVDLCVLSLCEIQLQLKMSCEIQMLEINWAELSWFYDISEPRRFLQRQNLIRRPFILKCVSWEQFASVFIFFCRSILFQVKPLREATAQVVPLPRGCGLGICWRFSPSPPGWGRCFQTKTTTLWTSVCWTHTNAHTYKWHSNVKVYKKQPKQTVVLIPILFQQWWTCTVGERGSGGGTKTHFRIFSKTVHAVLNMQDCLTVHSPQSKSQFFYKFLF